MITGRMANNSMIVLAGATGNLGCRIVGYLIESGATVRALVRHETAQGEVDKLRKHGVSVARVDYCNPREMAEACAGASCVVLALCGLEDVIGAREGSSVGSRDRIRRRASRVPERCRR